jgi:hypothetical protein
LKPSAFRRAAASIPERPEWLAGAEAFGGMRSSLHDGEDRQFDADQSSSARAMRPVTPVRAG